MELTTEERELLVSLGLNVSEDGEVTTVKKKRESQEAPPLVDLTGFSGTMLLNCKCCGNQELRNIDYVPRTDRTGFCIRFVDVTQHTPTRHHESLVYECSNCKVDILGKCEVDKLVTMISNLRVELRKGKVK